MLDGVASIHLLSCELCMSFHSCLWVPAQEIKLARFGLHCTGIKTCRHYPASKKITGTVHAPRKVTGTVHTCRKITGTVHESGKITGTLHSSRKITGTVHSSRKVTGTLHSSRKIIGTVHESGMITGTVQASAFCEALLFNSSTPSRAVIGMVNKR
jgi:hypothetical protein